MHTPINIFKLALAAGTPQIGLWAALASAYSTELLAGIGYDWLLIDGEHAPNDVRCTLAQLQAVASAQNAFGDARSHPIVRVPVGTGDVGVALIKQYLDIGAQTLLVPMIDTAEQADRVVKATRYAPAGIRGMGSALARASRWQAHARYVFEANDQICVLVQVETVEAMQNLDAIAATPGVDGVFIGPSDLSASMGHPGNAAHPEVQAVIADGVKRIRAAGKAPGILATSEAGAKQWLAVGAQFIAVGADTMLLASGASQLLAQFKGPVATAPNTY
ncbi:HpcH/HpaI aldolase/citrate lyase family protein [Hydrogenophaga sp.]|uniref:HpcH/HpaI aldolase/citrate lyase family protein n=1 Tax=Hydrogenophaga sp. TaxID=1904254 RepID=UPI0027312D9B|nr:HpcH/HpaI aldolase/citrate lyase family protein [Hydrogenophaga sp.]MDP2015203.1 HpcH/HpaI aldolase/citrate lyase family protein [Hydrogenophaga sp.]MDP3167736.1 HpcH/HpaI aldolase/citrate lyase family protein [Hydrogenophaga sp.]